MKRYLNCVVPCGDGRLLGTSDKFGKRLGYDKGDRPLIGSGWANSSGTLYQVVGVEGGNEEVLDKMDGKAIDKRKTEVSVMFKLAPVDAGVEPFSMSLQNWARRMIYVHDPIPSTARLTFGARANLTGREVPKRVYWDAASERFIRVSASGKTHYFMSDDFDVAWGSEHYKFPAYREVKDRTVTMALPLLDPKTVEGLKVLFSEPARNVPPQMVTLKNVRLSFDKVFERGIEKKATIPLFVYFDAAKNRFLRVQPNSPISAMSEAYNEKWRPRANEFPRITEATKKAVDALSQPERPALKVDEILKLIVEYLNLAGGQSERVRHLLKEVRDRGLKV
jgi:hypothetical protein